MKLLGKSGTAGLTLDCEWTLMVLRGVCVCVGGCSDVLVQSAMKPSPAVEEGINVPVLHTRSFSRLLGRPGLQPLQGRGADCPSWLWRQLGESRPTDRWESLWWRGNATLSTSTPGFYPSVLGASPNASPPLSLTNLLCHSLPLSAPMVSFPICFNEYELNLTGGSVQSNVLLCDFSTRG